MQLLVYLFPWATLGSITNQCSEIEKHIHYMCLPSTHHTHTTTDYVQSLMIHVTLRANLVLYGNHIPKDCVTNLSHVSLSRVASQKPPFFGNFVFEKFDLKMGILSIIYCPASIIQNPSSCLGHQIFLFALLTSLPQTII